MTVYRFRAATLAGEVVEDEIDADSEESVVNLLHGRGQVPIQISESVRSSLRTKLGKNLFERGPSVANVAEWTRHLAMLVGAGIPVDRALELLLEFVPVGRQKDVVNAVLEKVRSGTSLADALAAQHETFPGFLVGLVRAGEAGNHLGEALSRAAEHLETAGEMRAKLRSALLYPAIVLAMTTAAIVLLLVYVLPQFRPIFADAGNKLPPITRSVLAASDWLEAYWPFLILVLVSTPVAVRAIISHPSVREWFDGAILKVPLVGKLLLQSSIADFARTLSALTANGVVLDSAIVIAKESVSNVRIAKAIDMAGEGLRTGKGFAEPLRRTGVFPNVAVQLIRTGEEADRLAETLEKLATVYSQEAQQRLGQGLTLLVPLVTIALGAIVALVVGSVISAVLSVYQLAV